MKRIYIYFCVQGIMIVGECRDMVEYELNIEIWGESNE